MAINTVDNTHLVSQVQYTAFAACEARITAVPTWPLGDTFGLQIMQ